jgi:WD40 repeat protein
MQMTAPIRRLPSDLSRRAPAAARWPLSLLLLLLCACLWACGPTISDPNNPTQGSAGGTNPDGSPAEAPLAGPITDIKLKAGSLTPDWVEDVTASQDGKHIHLITRDGGFWRWIPAEGKVERLRTLGDEREQTSLRPGGTLALAIHGDAPRLFDANTGREIMRFASWTGAREAIWSPAGKHFILANQDGTLALWNVEEQLSGYREGEKLEDFLNRQEPKYQIEMDGQIRRVALTPDGRMAVAVDEGGKKGSLYIGDLAKLNAGDASAMKFLGRTNGDVTALALSSDARTLLAINQDRSARAVATDKQGFAPWADGAQAVNATWTPTGGLVVLVTPSGSLRAFDPKLGRVVWETPGAFTRCFAAAPWFVCTDGRALSLLSAGGGAPVVSLATWGDQHLLYTQGGQFWGSAPPAEWLAASASGKPVTAGQWEALRDLAAVKVLAVP